MDPFTILAVISIGATLFKGMYDFTMSLQEKETQQKEYEDTKALAEKQLTQEKDIADKNFSLSKEQFEYQKQLNNLQMQREDTAMQRQVADLKSAGLSPLMASNGSPTGQLISASAPQYNSSGIMSALSNLIGVKNDYRNRRQAALQFERQQNINTAQQYADLASLKAQIKNQNLQNKLLEQQYNYNQKHGVRDPNPAAALADAIMAYVEGNDITPPSPQEIKDKVNEVKDTLTETKDKLIEQSKENVQKSKNKLKNVFVNTGKSIVRPFVNIYNRYKYNRAQQSKKYKNKEKQNDRL